MSAFKAWAIVALFGNLGMIVALGYQFPKQPYCQTYCFVDAMSHFQDSVGSLTMASILFFMGFIGFMWYSLRP